MPGPAVFIFQGPGSIEPAGGIPGPMEAFLSMARKAPRFHSSKLTDAENRTVNRMIKRSWSNGCDAGRRITLARLYSSGRIRRGTR